MTDWNPQANKILLEALAIEGAEARAEYLDRVCAGNAQLRAVVDELLAAHAEAGQFLGTASRRTEPQAASVSMFPPGARLAGRFVIRRELGQGGMGVVLLADQTQPVRRQVAIKLIKSGLDVRSVALRFDQERNALAVMDHPNIARIYEAGVVDVITGEELPAEKLADEESYRAIPFFAMEYLQGIPINDYCDRHRLTPRARLELFIPVCQAVQHAHQKGIVHRDLKPSNILVELIDEQPVAKVIDFGVAKATGAKLTEQSLHTSFGSIVGTLEYMSPEQARFSDDIDTRADVYALGAVLYELLVGSVPHRPDNLRQAGLEEMLRIIKEVDAPPPSARLSGSGTLPAVAADRAILPAKLVRLVRGDLDWIVLKALDKERNRRYDSVTGLAADIQRYLDEEPVLARPPSALYRVRKAYRRHRAAFFAAGLALALLLLGTVGTSLGFVAASRNAASARAEARRASAAEAQARAALVEAEEQRDLAETQRGISEAVTEFLLSDLLRQADVSHQAYQLLAIGEEPSLGLLKRNPTILELLDRAAEKLAPDQIEQRFPDQPSVQASLLTTVGYVYSSIGEDQKAIELLQRGRALNEQVHGQLKTETLMGMGYLVMALNGARKYDEALEVALEAFERTTQAFGELDERTLFAAARLSAVYASMDDMQRSIAVAEQAVEHSKNAKLFVMPSQSALQHDFEFLLATKYSRARRWSEAAELLERTWAERKTRLGDDHPKSLLCGSWLAGVYLGAADHERARDVFEFITPRLEELFGEDHPHAIAARENLGACYRRLGDPQKAIEVYTTCLGRRLQRHGADGVPTLHIQANLGVAYFDTERYDRAIELLAPVVARSWEEPGLLFAVETLFRSYQKDGQLEQAEQLCRQYLQHAREKYPRRLRSALFALALLMFQQEAYDQAEPLLRELIELNEQQAPNSWNSFNAKSLLGKVLLQRGELQEAEPVLLAGYAGMQQRYRKIPLSVRFHVRDAAEWLAELYDQQGDAQQAERWRAEGNQYTD